MPTKLCKWGNSLGLRLPQYVIERTGLRPGDYLAIRLADSGDIVIRAVTARDIPAGFKPDELPNNFKAEVMTDEEVRAKW